MSDKPELNPCPFRHIEKDYEHELSVIKDPEKHGLARVCCRCGYRSPVMGFDKESVIVAHNSLADLAKPSEWISVETELPEEQQQVLVVGRDRRRRVQLIQWWRGDQDDYSYWQAITPLPSPPTRETP